MKITACVIVKNEEENLPKWLKYIDGIADEIVIVDTGSTDNTKEIAAKSRAQVYDFKWCDDFAAAKNFAIDKATGDWIVFLDADEYFVQEALESVKNNIRDVNKNMDAFLCKIENIIDNKAVSIFYNVRIFRNKSNLRYKGCIHEHLINTHGKKVDAMVMPAHIIIYHTGYVQIMMPEKIARNYKLLKKDIRENGLRATHYIYLAECYIAMKDEDKALKCCEKFIAGNSDAVGMRAYMYGKWLGILINKKTDYILADEIADRALLEFPENGEMLYFKALILYLQKKYILSQQCFEKILQLKKINNDLNASMLAGKYTEIYAYLGEIYKLKGQLNKAIEYYTKSLQQNCFNKDVLTALYSIIKKIEDTDKIELLNSIYYNDKNKLMFLMEILYNQLTEKISLYYKQILREQYKIMFEGDIAKDFFITGNIEGTNNMLQLGLNDNYKFLSANIICKCISNNEWENKLPNKYKDIIMKYNYYTKLKTETINKKICDDIEIIIKKYRKK